MYVSPASTLNVGVQKRWASHSSEQPCWRSLQDIKAFPIVARLKSPNFSIVFCSCEPKCWRKDSSAAVLVDQRG